MLHKQAVSPFLNEALINLMGIDELKDYRLVGGTALSLLLGHRKSIDIDLFAAKYIHGDELKMMMKKYFPRTEIRDLGFGISIYIPIPDSKSELKVDIMSNEEFIRPPAIEEGIRFAHIDDIIAMKLEAITSRSEKKDYWDIAELMGYYTLKQMVEFYSERYPWNDLRDVMERITMFDRCDNQSDPECLNGKTWSFIKEVISKSFDEYIAEERSSKKYNTSKHSPEKEEG